jgi:hypothetical protein
VVEPSALACDTCRIPPEIVVTPSNAVLFPDTINVLDPDLAKSPAPEMVPDNV